MFPISASSENNEHHFDWSEGEDVTGFHSSSSSSSLCSLLLTPSPKRLRIAPWASRNPKPFVDPPSVLQARKQADLLKVADHQVSAARVESPPGFSTHRQPDSDALHGNPPTRLTPTSPAQHALSRAAAAVTSSSPVERNLLRLLFPELCEEPNVTTVDVFLGNSTDNISDKEAPDPQEAVSWEPSYVDPAQSPCNPTSQGLRTEALPLPFTPSSDKDKQEQADAATFRFQPKPEAKSTSLRRLRVYSSRKRSRPINQSDSKHEFQQVAGITTTERAAKYPRNDSKNSPGVQDSRNSVNKLSINNALPREEVTATEAFEPYGHEGPDDAVGDVWSPDARDSVAKVHEFESPPRPQEVLSPIYHTRSHTARKAVGTEKRQDQCEKSYVSPTRRSEPQHRNGDAEVFVRNAQRVTLRDSSTRNNQAHQRNLNLQLEDEPRPRGKRDDYKQYVYQRILAYPHRCDEEEEYLRPGHVPLEMGYLIPTPSDASDDAEPEGSNSRFIDERSIREMKLMILGRASQTAFGRPHGPARRGTGGKAGYQARQLTRRQQSTSTESGIMVDQGSRLKPLLHIRKIDAIRNALAITSSEPEATIKGMNSKTQIVAPKQPLKETSTRSTKLTKPQSKKAKRQRQRQPIVAVGHAPLLLDIDRPRKVQPPGVLASQDQAEVSNETGAAVNTYKCGADSGVMIVEQHPSASLPGVFRVGSLGMQGRFYEGDVAPLSPDDMQGSIAAKIVTGNAYEEDTRQSLPEGPLASSPRHLSSTIEHKREKDTIPTDPQGDDSEAPTSGHAPTSPQRADAGLDFLSASEGVATSLVSKTFLFQLAHIRPSSPESLTSQRPSVDSSETSQRLSLSILAPNSSYCNTGDDLVSFAAGATRLTGYQASTSLERTVRLSMETQSSPQAIPVASTFQHESDSQTEKVPSIVVFSQQPFSEPSQELPMPAQPPLYRYGFLGHKSRPQTTFSESQADAMDPFLMLPSISTLTTTRDIEATPFPCENADNEFCELPKQNYGRQITGLDHLYPAPRPIRKIHRRRILQSGDEPEPLQQPSRLG